jgi:hypothetical protein
VQYVVFCYDREDVVHAWSQEEDDAVMAKLSVVHEKLDAEGKLGPYARLLGTSTATSIKTGRDSVVLDGPFAETKEQLLGFYFLDCDSFEEAVEATQRLARAREWGTGVMELRPVRLTNVESRRSAPK